MHNAGTTRVQHFEEERRKKLQTKTSVREKMTAMREASDKKARKAEGGRDRSGGCREWRGGEVVGQIMTYEPKINSVNKRKRRLRWGDERREGETVKESKGGVCCRDTESPTRPPHAPTAPILFCSSTSFRIICGTISAL